MRLQAGMPPSRMSIGRCSRRRGPKPKVYRTGRRKGNGQGREPRKTAELPVMLLLLLLGVLQRLEYWVGMKRK